MPVSPTHRRAFTLTELLVVISIIVLVMAMAVPLFNVFSTGRSIDAGENLVSATLQRARARAIGLQEPRGLFFYTDPATGRTAMIGVRIVLADTTQGAYFGLEIDEGQEEAELLPDGVGAAFAIGYDPNSTSAGANTLYSRPGIVMFDGYGRIKPMFIYGAPDYVGKPADGNRLRNKLKTLLALGTDPGGALLPGLATANGVVTATTDAIPTQSVVMLFEKKAFAGLNPAPGTPPHRFNTDQATWLDQNCVALVINRYNGTLIRSE